MLATGMLAVTHVNDVCLKTFERPRVDLIQSKIDTVVLVCFSVKAKIL